MSIMRPRRRADWTQQEGEESEERTVRRVRVVPSLGLKVGARGTGSPLLRWQRRAPQPEVRATLQSDTKIPSLHRPLRGREKVAMDWLAGVP